MKESPPSTQTVPQSIIYEMIRGIPVYYQGIESISGNEARIEEIMGSSFLQAQLVAMIVGILFSKLDLTKYVITTNEAGFRCAENSFRALDIAVFEKEKVKDELLSAEYVKTPPNIVIEIDTKAEMGRQGNLLAYWIEKTDDLLNAGVERVIWIMTAGRKTMTAEQKQPWMITRWEEDIRVMNDIRINLNEIIDRISASSGSEQ